MIQSLYRSAFINLIAFRHARTPVEFRLTS